MLLFRKDPPYTLFATECLLNYTVFTVLYFVLAFGDPTKHTSLQFK